MKTSNKILLIGVAIMIIAGISTTYIIKQKIQENMIKGSGVIIEKEFAVSSFDKVRVEHINFELIQSDHERVVLSIDDNLQGYFTAEVSEDGLLVLKKKNGAYYNTQKIIAKIYYKNIYAVRGLSGDGSGEIKGDSIFVDFSAGGDGNFTLNANSATIHCSSGADLILKGTARNIDITGGSGAGIDAEEIRAETCSINIGSGANAAVFVTETIKGNVSSGASLVYHGNTKNARLESSSGGDIKRKE